MESLKLTALVCVALVLAGVGVLALLLATVAATAAYHWQTAMWAMCALFAWRGAAWMAAGVVQALFGEREEA